MCLTCGCGDPPNDHDDPRNIVLSQLEDAAEASDISPWEAALNILTSLAGVEGAAPEKDPPLSWACDFDGTISAAPSLFANLMRSLKAGGTKVTVLTGNKDAQGMLDAMAMSDCYDAVVVVDGTDEQVAAGKADYCQANGVHILIDDKAENISAVSQVIDAAQFIAGPKMEDE